MGFFDGVAVPAGVFAPQVPKEYGGQALSQVGRAHVFEAAGYSILGPTAIHCASPDEGKVHLIERMESRHGIHTLEHAEAIGIGSRQYELVDLDK